MRLSLVPLFSVPLFAALVAVAACSNEAEGEPCSRDNNNDDCQDGYACVTPLNTHATNASYVCCPGEGQTPTTAACMANGAVDSGNPIPPDGSTVPETSMGSESSTSDAKSETAADGGAETSSDGGPG
jgi:hypothetical protein